MASRARIPTEMIANCYELIADVSSACTLNPGDIILTGTPDGSGLFHSPPFSLQNGDVVRIEIEGIGAIENRVMDESPVPALDQSLRQCLRCTYTDFVKPSKDGRRRLSECVTNRLRLSADCRGAVGSS